MRRRYDRWTWIVRISAAGQDFESLLEDPDGALETSANIIKASDSTTVARVTGYVMKKWTSHGMGGYLKDALRGTRAERAALHALQLMEAGIPTAEPLAWGAADGWGRKSCSCLIMEELHGVTDLGQWKGDRLSIFGRFGCLLGNLHRHGFTHRDLKPTNLLVDPGGNPYLIDLDGLRRSASVSSARAVADLVKLARRMVELSTLSPREAVEFVTRYASARGTLSRRTWWENIKGEAFLHQEFSMRSRLNR
jgi:tRNA A-37 threonylcarbamoyl transferase component Bud32